MKAIVSLSAATFFLYSCASQKPATPPPAPAIQKKTAEQSIAEEAYKKAAYEDNQIPTPPTSTHLPAPRQNIAPTLSEPANIPVPSATAAATPTPPSIAGGRTHTVGAGDSLWKIAKQYNVSIDSIKAANGMTKDTAVLGKKLIIPDSVSPQ